MNDASFPGSAQRPDAAALPRLTDPVARLRPPPDLWHGLTSCHVRTIADLVWLADTTISHLPERPLRERLFALRHQARIALAQHQVVVDDQAPWQQILGALPAPLPQLLRAHGLVTMAELLTAAGDGRLDLRATLPRPVYARLRERLILLERQGALVPRAARRASVRATRDVVAPRRAGPKPRAAASRFDPHALARRLRDQGVDLGTRWPLLLGATLPPRAYNALSRLDLRSIGDILEAVADRRLIEQPNFGRVSQHLLLTALERLGEKGIERPPGTVHELVERVLTDPTLEETDQQLLGARLLRGETLRALGQTMGISGERVRQRERALIDRIQRVLGPVAVHLVMPLLDALSRAGGILHRSVASRLLGEADLQRVRFALRLAGNEDCEILGHRFLYQGSLPALNQRLSRLRGTLDSLCRDQDGQRTPINLATAQLEAAQVADMRLDPRSTASLVRDLLSLPVSPSRTRPRLAVRLTRRWDQRQGATRRGAAVVGSA